MKDKPLENDRYLVEACIKRDLMAWNAFIKKYSRLVSVSIQNRAKKYGFNLSSQDIEDIRQNAFTSIWKDNKLAGVVNRGDVSYWLSIVSGNEAMLHLRNKETRQMQDSISLLDKINGKELSEIIPSDNIDPHDEAVKNELSGKIDEGMALLSAKEKLIIKLNLIHGKKYHEIADMLDIPKGTVSNYIKRGKEKLKEILKNMQQF